MAHLTGQKRRTMEDTNTTSSVGNDFATLKSLVSAFSSKSVDKRKSMVESKTNEMLKTFASTTVSQIIKNGATDTEMYIRELIQPLLARKKVVEELRATVKNSRLRALQQLMVDTKALDRLYQELNETLSESDQLFDSLQTMNSNSMDDNDTRIMITTSIDKLRDDLEQRMEKYKQEMRYLLKLLGDTTV